MDEGGRFTRGLHDRQPRKSRVPHFEIHQERIHNNHLAGGKHPVSPLASKCTSFGSFPNPMVAWKASAQDPTILMAEVNLVSASQYHPANSAYQHCQQPSIEAKHLSDVKIAGTSTPLLQNCLRSPLSRPQRSLQRGSLPVVSADIQPISQGHWSLEVSRRSLHSSKL